MQTSGKHLVFRRAPVLAVLVLAAGCAARSAFAVEGAWAVDSDGDWSNAANWTSNPLVPNGADARAILGGAIGASRTITLDTDVTLGALIYNDADVYRIVSSNNSRLVFQSTSGPAILDFAPLAVGYNGMHRIEAPIYLASDLLWANNTVRSFELFAGPISGPGGFHLDNNAKLYTSTVNPLTGAIIAHSGQVNILSTGSFLDVSGIQIERYARITIASDAGNTPGVNSVRPHSITFHGGRLELQSLTLDPTKFVAPASSRAIISYNTSGTITTDLNLSTMAGGTDDGDKIYLVGARTNTFTGKFSFAPGATHTTVHLGSIPGVGGSTARFLVASDLLAANHVTGVMKDGPEMAVLSGNNTYPGLTVVNGPGVLAVRSNTALGSASGTDADATVVNPGGTLQIGYQGGTPTAYDLGNEKIIINGGKLLLDYDTSSVTLGGPVVLTGTANFSGSRFGLGATRELLMKGAVSGSGVLEKSDLFNLRLDAFAAHSGGTVVRHGTLTVGSSGSLVDAAGLVVLPDGSLVLEKGPGNDPPLHAVRPNTVVLHGGKVVVNVNVNPGLLISPDSSSEGTVHFGVRNTHAINMSTLRGGLDGTDLTLRGLLGGDDPCRQVVQVAAVRCDGADAAAGV